MNDSASRWYVVQSKPHKEEVVARSLTALGVDHFLPRILERVRAGIGLQQRVSPLFPSYLFVNLDLARSGKDVRYTPGVRDFVRFASEPQSVPPHVISALRERIGPTGVFVPEKRHFAPGARLRIEEGPLRGLEVIFERELSGAERVAVLLAEMTLPARVILRSDMLAPNPS
jgi:transcriptional antiterminator RfaH